MKQISAAGRKARLPEPRAHDVPVEYLYVPCVHTRYDGHSAQTRCWVQAVPIVKKTAKWIYYTSDSWNPREAVVSPGCINREQMETDARCHGPGPAGRKFFATREAAEDDLRRGVRARPERAAPQEAPIKELLKELRHVMVDAHPDRGGTAEQFIQARRRYEAALRAA
ncbi:MAG TPA: hypothetical protein VF060_19890 [Trebonia sp.]